MARTLPNPDNPNDNGKPSPLWKRALKANTTETSLGSRSVVEWLLRNYVDDYVEGLKAGTQAADLALLIGGRAAKVFLGQDSGYVPLYKWNEPGGIDVHLAKWCGSSEQDAESRIVHAMVVLFQEVQDILEIAGTPDVRDEQWTFMFDTALERWSYLLLGMSPGSIDAMEEVGELESADSE